MQIHTKKIFSQVAGSVFNVSGIGAGHSPEGRMHRFTVLLDSLLPMCSGNLVEIGAGSGMTTRVLLQAAETFNRRVLAIDPFEDGWASMPVGYGVPYPHAVFREQVKGMESRLTLCQNLSASSFAWEAIDRHRPIAFAFLDGLQYQGNVVKELEMMQKAKAVVIAVDDVNRLTDVSQVPLALREFLERDGCEYEMATVCRPLIEGYLIRKNI